MTTTPETTTKPVDAASRLKEDKGPEPMFQKGDRVVFIPDEFGNKDIEGRHGTITHVETMRWKMQAIMGGGATEVEHGLDRYYHVKTDAGYKTTHTKSYLLEREATPAPAVIPDPLDCTGDAVTPEALCRSLQREHKSMMACKAAAGRARVQKSIDKHNREAEHYRICRENLLACLDAWCAKYPQGRAEYAGIIDATLRVIENKPALRPAGAPGLKPTMRENEQMNGVELRFGEKPDAETIGTLKRNGWRWAMRSRCWYIRRSPETLAFAKALAGVEGPAAAPSGPDPVDMAYEDQCAAATAA